MSEADQEGSGLAWRGFRGYTRAEMAAASALTRAEDPRWRWMLPVTGATRDFIRMQLPLLQVSYGVAVALIYLAGHFEGVVNPQLMNLWLVESSATFAIRSLLYVLISRASLVEVVRNPALRLLPLLAITLAALHWSWTATIFIGTALNLTTVVVLLAFVMLSVACIVIAPASPVSTVVYLVPLWSVTTYKLIHAEWVSMGTFAVLFAALSAVLWSAFYIVVSGVRRYLVRGDEVDLLVAELRERNAEVEGLRAAGAKDFATRSAFFGSASHDFRQRVHAMKLLTQSGFGDAAALRGDTSLFLRLIGVIEDLETYMTDVLEFARLESASLDPQGTRLRLQDVFQRIDVQFEDIAAAKNVDLRVRATSLVLHTDGAMLIRILENLVSNAIKFTRARVLVTARRRGREVYVEVRDQGCGIPLDTVDVVFDAFYQGENTVEGGSQGVGLGLAIVKRLSDALGYRIEVLSQPGRGTVMRLVVSERELLE